MQAEKRRDNRFNAMLFDWYGGRKAIRHVIKTGRLVQIRLGQTHRNLEFRSSVKSDIPPPRARYTRKEKKSDRRARYYGKMAKQLREAGVSTASQEALKRRRAGNIMKLVRCELAQ